MLDLLLAAALLLGDPEAEVSPEHFAAAPIVRLVAIQWELLDESDAYTLRTKEYFTDEIGMLRRRCRCLANAPPAADAMRFPTRETADQYRAFNRSYVDWLRVQQAMRHDLFFEVELLIYEADQLYHIWGLVSDAQSSGYYVWTKREALAKLRDVLGPAAYYACELPPCVPVHRWRRVE